MWRGYVGSKTELIVMPQERFVAVLKILSALGLIAAIAWLVYAPGFEPTLAILGALSALISLFVVDRRKHRVASQSQSVSRSSTGIQAAGDIHIRTAGTPARDE